MSKISQEISRRQRIESEEVAKATEQAATARTRRVNGGVIATVIVALVLVLVIAPLLLSAMAQGGAGEEDPTPQATTVVDDATEAVVTEVPLEDNPEEQTGEGTMPANSSPQGEWQMVTTASDAIPQPSDSSDATNDVTEEAPDPTASRDDASAGDSQSNETVGMTTGEPSDDPSSQGEGTPVETISSDDVPAESQPLTEVTESLIGETESVEQLGTELSAESQPLMHQPSQADLVKARDVAIRHAGLQLNGRNQRVVYAIGAYFMGITNRSLHGHVIIFVNERSTHYDIYAYMISDTTWRPLSPQDCLGLPNPGVLSLRRNPNGSLTIDPLSSISLVAELATQDDGALFIESASGDDQSEEDTDGMLTVCSSVENLHMAFRVGFEEYVSAVTTTQQAHTGGKINLSEFTNVGNSQSVISTVGAHIELPQDSITLTPRTQYTVDGHLSKPSALEKAGIAVSYKMVSSNDAVVTVTDGYEENQRIIEPKGDGMATITVYAYANGLLKDTATMTVSVSGFKKGQTITASDKVVTIGKETPIGASADGKGKLSYKSQSASIAKVTQTGKIQPVKRGTTTVTVSAAATSTHKAASKKISVKVKGKGNPLVAKAKSATVTVAYSKVRQGKQTPATNLVVSKGQGKVSYKNVSTNATAKKFPVNAGTGRVTIPKGTKKGTYAVKIQVKARGNAKYEPSSKTIQYKIKVA